MKILMLSEHLEPVKTKNVPSTCTVTCTCTVTYF